MKCLFLILVYGYLGFAYITRNGPRPPDAEAVEAVKSKETRREYVLKRFSFLEFCGFQHSDEYFHHINDTDLNEYPWLVHMEYSSYYARETRTHICAGVLISNMLVLTTSTNCGMHYVKNIKIGQYHLYNSTSCADTYYGLECTDPVIVTFASRQKVENTDFLLLRLEKRLQFTDFVRPICLPFEESQRPAIEETVYTSGWGEESVEGTNTRLKLTKKKLAHEIISFQDGEYEKDAEISFGKNNSSKYVCTGDQGGPLMYSNRKHQWFLAGIIMKTPCNAAEPAVAYRITNETLNNVIEAIFNFLVY